ncbi:MAG: sulfite exporter TauE/SafE family protein, partial [Deltaproteobacteria bacterium]|nr:sulfite exporter TauE/SafE family protein [Deltaproteobacteria bacterium]
AVLLQRARPDLMLLILGTLLVVAGGAFLLPPQRRAIRWPLWAAPPTGLLAGVLAGTFGTGGPPLILYYQLSGVDKSAFRANLMAIFLVITCVRVPTYAVAGLITSERLLAALMMLPAVLLGAYLGNRIHVRLSEQAFRRAVCVALMLIGAVLIVQRIG